MRKLWVLFIFLAFSACENVSEQVKTLSEDQKKDLGELEVELRSVASTLTSCKFTEECTVVGFNPKVCSGYEDYVALSQVSNTAGQATIHAPTKDYLYIVSRIQGYEQRVKDSLKDGENNICLTVIEQAPRALCVANKCQLQAIAPFAANNDAEE